VRDITVPSKRQTEAENSAFTKWSRQAERKKPNKRKKRGRSSEWKWTLGLARSHRASHMPRENRRGAPCFGVHKSQKAKGV